MLKILKIVILRILIFGIFMLLIEGCREEGERSGKERSVFTIKEIQDWNEPRHPSPVTTVTIEDVIVTAVDMFDEDGGGHIGNVWVSMLDGSGIAVCAQWCGITVYNPSVVIEGGGLRIGDVVTITGVYDEFVYNDDGSPPDSSNLLQWYSEHLSEINNGTVWKTGEWISPAPIEVPAWQVQSEPRGGEAMTAVESLEGVLVLVRNLTVKSDYDKYGQFETEEGVMIEDDLFHYPCSGYQGSIVGVHFESVTGVVTWFGMKGVFGNFKILPRGAEDFSPPPDSSLCN